MDGWNKRYWEQFMKTGRVADYLDYKAETGKISPCGKNRQDRGKRVESDCIDGLVLQAAPVGEYDRRVVILTKEQGKISAFARGGREDRTVRFCSCEPLSFGEFTVYAGRSSYTVQSAKISNYFSNFGKIWRALTYGFYFLEFASYYKERGK